MTTCVSGLRCGIYISMIFMSESIILILIFFFFGIQSGTSFVLHCSCIYCLFLNSYAKI